MKKKKTPLICLFFILLVSFSVPNMKLVNSDDIPSIYSLITIELNGVTKEDLTAQLLIFNETSQTYEENEILKNRIIEDLNWLSHQISDLDDIFVHNFNDTLLPGNVDFLLANVSLNDNSVYDQLSVMIDSDNDRWWYVDTVTPSILLPDGPNSGYAFAEYHSPLDITLFCTYNESYPGGVRIVNFLSKDGIIASKFINDGEKWIENNEYHEILVSSLLSLKNMIFEIDNLNMTWPESDWPESTWSGEALPLINLSEPIVFNETFHYVEEFRYLGRIYLNIYYKSCLTKNKMKTVHKILDMIIAGNWYFNNFIAIAGGNDADFPLLVSVIPTLIFALAILNRKKKRLKTIELQ
ncbi:MAG: hypothetical protein KGD64_13355 [Candidatus Heimdallarchaeota archaeon]|nr:hypothetical protein [Candidatus Heimdallarchaeota archaeon]